MKSTITGLRVLPGVAIGGSARDLLLVATQPWLIQELVMLGDASDESMASSNNVYSFRENALWVFDITGDAASFTDSVGVKVPKLLMSSSQGIQSPNWIKGLGGAGGMLGTIKLRGGLTVWDAGLLKGAWDQDAAESSAWSMSYRTASINGYFPDPQTIVASNGKTHCRALSRKRAYGQGSGRVEIGRLPNRNLTV